MGTKHNHVPCEGQDFSIHGGVDFMLHFDNDYRQCHVRLGFVTQVRMVGALETAAVGSLQA